MYLMDFYQSFEIDYKDDIDLLSLIFQAKLKSKYSE